MTTAVDTNVLLDIWLNEKGRAEAALDAIELVAQAGRLIVSDIVYAELCGHFTHQGDCDRFLRDAEILVEPLNEESCFLASRIWIQYRKQAGPRARILPDFLIGAHAQVQASRLLSRDAGFFRKPFPRLALVDPSRTA
ncbi:MAG: type II toxin-antitoxin system VapC family toxin [Verrucomicrobiota bacterium]